MSYRVRKFSFDQDKEQLFNLWGQVLDSPDRKRLNDLYTDNGYGQPSTWLVIHDETDTPVGSASVFPRKIMSAGQPVLIGINCDMLILKKHRTLGPALILLKTLIRESEDIGYQVLLAFPGEKAKVVFKRTGYKNIGPAFRWAKVLNSKEKFASFFSNTAILNFLSFLSNSALRVITLEFWARIFYPQLWLESIGEQLSLEEMYFPESSSDDNQLIKNNRYMKWRYNLLRPEKAEVFVLSRLSNVMGYIVYTSTGYEAIIHDLFFSEPSGNFHVLMAKFIEKIRGQGMHTVSLLYFGPYALTRKLKLHGYMKREARDLFLKSFGTHFIDNSTTIADISFFDGDVDL